MTDQEFTINPSWVVTFLRFQNRAPNVLGNSFGSASDVRKPLVVINDCIELSVNDSKSSPNGSVQMVFKLGDINYLTAISPGDYFTVNINYSEEKSLEIYKRILGDKGAGPENINNAEDGFKGVFRVQSVHKTLVVGPNGQKIAATQITGYSFVELNDVIYFNPYLVTAAEKSNDVLFLTQLSTQWNKIIGLKNNNNSVQDLMILLFQVFLGRGFDEKGRTLKGGLKRTENNLYLLPKGLGRLLGHKNAKHAADIVNLMCGIQSYKSTQKKDAPGDLINPSNLKANGRIYTTNAKVRGVSYAKPEYWNQIRVWDILNSYLNNVVNEMYTSFKFDYQTGFIMPTLTIRQKPFTTDRYVKKNPNVLATPFRSLPRWIIDPAQVTDFHTGRDDAARINFVQVFGRSQSLMGGSNADIDQQIAMGNYAIDREDIKRNGLRPLITNSNFDYAGSDTNSRLSQAPLWAQLLGDWVIGGHMKMSGSITMIGQSRPIAVGDNCEFDGIIYHIEGVQHTCKIGGKGERIYRTILQLSSGVSIEENSGLTEFAEMIHTDADLQRIFKLKNKDTEINDPGVSDSQDLPLASNRSNAEKTAPNAEIPFDATLPPKDKPKASGTKLTNKRKP
jgi:hypothetical protein